MKKLQNKEKLDFIKFIKEQFGKTDTYDQNGFPLYFDNKGNIRTYDLDEGYNIFKLHQINVN